jgi:4'-phosphopantetheinyl transferase
MQGRTGWTRPPSDYTLRRDEVHVWRIRLDHTIAYLPCLAALLAADERREAERYRMAADRARYVAGRGALRCLLARYLDTLPQQVPIEHGERGKPRLADFASAMSLQFNLSHSGQLLLIAIAAGRAIGIDVEDARRNLEVERIAERFFSVCERAALASLPAPLRREAFFACWTRKEAYLKAKGDGLALPLDWFDVSVLPGGPARLLATRPDPDEARRWTLHDLDVGPDHKGALAVEGDDCQLRTWECPLHTLV